MLTSPRGISVETERYELETTIDVHRAHAIGNAILVAERATHRLALAHAWRAGVRRWVLLHTDDELVAEIRVLLDELGAGGAAPAHRIEDLDWPRLFGDIERVFVDDPVVADAGLPPSFAAEAEVLDAIAPLVRATSLEGCTRYQLPPLPELGERLRALTEDWRTLAERVLTATGMRAPSAHADARM